MVHHALYDNQFLDASGCGLGDSVEEPPTIKKRIY